MRVFVGLDIPEEIRQRMARFMDGLRGFAPDVRWVRPDSFHVTLKFIGEREPEQVEAIRRELASVRAAPVEVSFRGHGFFPNPRNPRVFWVGVEADESLPRLAAAVDEAVSRTGVPREANSFKPHLTLSRSGSGSPHPKPGDWPSARLGRLAEKLAGKPQADFGTMTAREFFLYESKLGPGGARYSQLQGFPLR
jgi:2'-5' RNA ligase